MLKLFTFCVNIQRHMEKDLVSTLKILIASLDYYVKEYKLIVFKNFDIPISNPNVEFRDYYNKAKHSTIPWLNLCFNEFYVFEDLYKEFNECFTWTDIDLIVTYDISYIEYLDNFFVEVGGNCEDRVRPFTNHIITVSRNRYLQGSFWKMNMEMYNEMMVDTLNEIITNEWKLQYSNQDLISYHVLIKKQSKNVNILGKTFKPNAIGSFSAWDPSGKSHASYEGLLKLAFDKDGILRTNYYKTKEIHILNFTFATLRNMRTTIQLKQLFKHLNVDLSID